MQFRQIDPSLPMFLRALRRRRRTEESKQGMAHVEDEHTPGPARGGTAVAEGRSERGSGLKVRPREDGEQINPDEFKDLLDSYDNSFRNIAEGEVVKGTVLKVTPSEVIVDVGY